MANYKDNKPGRIPTRPRNQRISLGTAIDLTKRHQRASPASEKAGFFFAKGIADLLAQPEVYGMRVYHGLDAKGRYRMVLVGVDRAGNDIVRTKKVLASGAVARSFGDAVLLDGHWPCPPFCPPDSPL
ncbi:MAG: hypothetical protein IT361_04975 [Gemmatimonadaceae bacterium]|nr:hypothetical protein [Gemmatimonadaceae bacterium]